VLIVGKKYRNLSYLAAIKRRNAIEKADLKPGDTVTVDNIEYIFKKIVTGGRMSLKPVAGGRGAVFNPVRVHFKGQPIVSS